MKKIAVIKGKSGPGRKPYKHADEFTQAIQFYRKGSEIKALGGIQVVRTFCQFEFDKRLAKIKK